MVQANLRRLHQEEIQLKILRKSKMAPRKGQGFKRRVIDKKASLRAYEARMHTLSDETMERLANKWIASFEMYDTYGIDDEEIDRRYDDFMDNSTFRLAWVCKQRNIPIRGCTSSRRVRGKRIAAIREDELEDIVYVGPHCAFFPNFKSSVFSLRAEDKRYAQRTPQVPQEPG